MSVLSSSLDNVSIQLIPLLSLKVKFLYVLFSLALNTKYLFTRQVKLKFNIFTYYKYLDRGSEKSVKGLHGQTSKRFKPQANGWRG